MSKCICGEINARHCPVHNESVNHREWWINLKEIEIWEMKENAPEGSILVVEYSAFEQLREENEQLKLQIQKERRKSEAEIERLNRDVSSWSHKAAQHRAEADSLKLMAESSTLKLAKALEALKPLSEHKCIDVCDEIAPNHFTSKQEVIVFNVRKLIEEARKTLEGK